MCFQIKIIFESKLYIEEKDQSTLPDDEVSLKTLPNINICDLSHDKNLTIKFDKGFSKLTSYWKFYNYFLYFFSTIIIIIIIKKYSYLDCKSEDVLDLSVLFPELLAEDDLRIEGEFRLDGYSKPSCGWTGRGGAVSMGLLG